MPRPKLATGIRRDQIAEATLAEVASRGLAALNVAAVAKRVGIAPSALYRHYPSKDAMLDAVLERLGTRLLAILGEARSGQDDPVRALRELYVRHIALITENRGLPLVVLNDMLHGGEADRRVRVFGIFRTYLRGVAALLRAGQRLGHVRRDTSAPALAVLFIGLVQPPAMLWTVSGGTFDITRQSREAWPVFEQAIRVPQPPAPARRVARRARRVS